MESFYDSNMPTQSKCFCSYHFPIFMLIARKLEDSGLMIQKFPVLICHESKKKHLFKLIGYEYRLSWIDVIF